MAIKKHVQQVCFPTVSAPMQPIMDIRNMLTIATDVLICAWAFLRVDTSDISRLIRFMELMDDLTDYRSEELQAARSSEILLCLNGPMSVRILLRLVKLAIMRQMANIADPQHVAIVNAAIAELKDQTREDADSLIALRSMIVNMSAPARKRQRTG